MCIVHRNNPIKAFNIIRRDDANVYFRFHFCHRHNYTVGVCHSNSVCVYVFASIDNEHVIWSQKKLNSFWSHCASNCSNLWCRKDCVCVLCATKRKQKRETQFAAQCEKDAHCIVTFEKIIGFNSKSSYVFDKQSEHALSQSGEGGSHSQDNWNSSNNFEIKGMKKI